jgi:hypothetical protein
MLVDVDDLKLAGPKGCGQLEACVQKLRDVHDVCLLPPDSCFIGIKFTRDRERQTLLPSQPAFTAKSLKDYGMSDANACRTRMESKLQLQPAAPKDEACTTEPYASLVGGLMFLSNCTRPDIAQAVHVLAPLMENVFGQPPQQSLTCSQAGVALALWPRVCCPAVATSLQQK